jgi:MFS family permease
VITYIDGVCISNAAPFIRRDLGLSVDQMGYAFSIFAMAYFIFEMPCGHLFDGIGPRRVLLRVTLWWSLLYSGHRLDLELRFNQLRPALVCAGRASPCAG